MLPRGGGGPGSMARWWRTLGAAFALLALLGLAPALAQTGGAGRALALSDIHFDPLADPALADALAAAAVEDWGALFEHAAPAAPPLGAPLGAFGHDTPWPLWQSALARMQAVLPRPDMILFTGDFLVHGLGARFATAASDHSPQALRRFALKTVRFLALDLARRFPAVPILPVLGNNDSDCGDYALEPGGAFLAGLLPTLREMLAGDAALAPDLAPAWDADGNYDIPHPTLAHARIIGLDSVVLSARYHDRCGGGDDRAPARRTLEWLAARLDAASAAGERVWLLMHIPPGIDAYATLQAGLCTADPVDMWQPEALERFLALVRAHAPTLAPVLAGHTHMETFRLVGSGEDAVALLGLPGLSPIFGQNPAFQVITYDAEGVRDTETQFLANLAGADAATAAWRAGAPFTAAYALPRPDTAALRRLLPRLAGDGATRLEWLRRFATFRLAYWPLPEREGLAGPASVAAYRCATATVTDAAFRACACPGAAP